jgi:hypothetical protein
LVVPPRCLAALMSDAGKLSGDEAGHAYRRPPDAHDGRGQPDHDENSDQRPADWATPRRPLHASEARGLGPIHLDGKAANTRSGGDLRVSLSGPLWDRGRLLRHPSADWSAIRATCRASDSRLARAGVEQVMSVKWHAMIARRRRRRTRRRPGPPVSPRLTGTRPPGSRPQAGRSRPCAAS